MTQFTDSLITDGVLRKTDDGYVVQARVAKGGNVQSYFGAEIGMADRAVVRVYRPADEVFSMASIATYARKPITMGHPRDGVSPATWKDLAVGEIDRDVMRDGEFVSVPLLFRDAAAVAAMQAMGGPRELSMGYDAKIELRDGVTPSGEPYDAVMTDLKMNHVAVVPVARGGAELRTFDGAANWGAMPLSPTAETKGNPMDLQTVVLGDQAAQVAVADAPKIEAFKAAMTKRLNDMESAHATTIAAKDAEIAKAEAARDDAKGKVMTDADIDKRVQDRADLIAVAKSVYPEVKTAGLSDAAIRKSVVAAKLGDAITGKSDAYIDVRFDILAEDAATADPFADGMKDRKPAPVTSLDAVYAARNASLNDAWKTPAQKEA